MAFTILIVDDEENARKNISEFLQAKGYEVKGAGTLSEARKSLERDDADIILLDVTLPDGYGPILLEETAHQLYRPPIIIITGYGDIDTAVESMKNGASDFLTKPVDLDRLEKSLIRASEYVGMRRELSHLRETQQKKLQFVIGTTKPMDMVISHAKRAAEVSASVLITGETGTGKEILVQFIHQVGPRANKPFVDITCPAIQDTMLESELFGFEAGAFTGAEKRKHGLIEIADEGILFLDEISSMSLDIQAKILRVIEERKVRRVGGTSSMYVDVQIIAASNRDIKTLIKDGKFREDLYYRLNVVDLHLPALRERKEDIPELVGHFIGKFNARMGINIINVTDRAMDSLVKYQWPGNIRELSNAVERAMLFSDGMKIDMADLPTDITKPLN